MKRRQAFVLILVPAFLLAACGGGDKGNKAAGTTSTAPSTTAVPKPLPTPLTSGTDPAQIAKAQAAGLQAADFPADFTQQPEDPNQGLFIDAVWSELLGCLGVQNPPPAGKATSPTFRSGIATQGRSTVEYTTDPAAGSTGMALAGPKSPDCLKKVFTTDVERSKPDGATTSTVTVTPRTDVPQLGQMTLAWRIESPVNLSGLTVPIGQDFVVIFKGGTIIRLFFLDPSGQFPKQLEQDLVAKVAARS